MAQRVMAFQAAPRADQQPEPLIQTIPHLARGHRRHPRGRQLDGQRNPVEAPANLHHRVGLVGLAIEKREATLRARSTNRSTAAESIPAADIQRGHQPQLLVGDPQSFAAGSQDRTVAECARIASIRSPAASRTCSQLSNTNNRTRPSNAAATLRSRSCPVAG